jgi:hypothetical protein
MVNTTMPNLPQDQGAMEAEVFFFSSESMAHLRMVGNPIEIGLQARASP